LKAGRGRIAPGDKATETRLARLVAVLDEVLAE